MHNFSIFLVLAPVCLADSLSAALGPAFVEQPRPALDMTRFDRPDIYAAYPKNGRMFLEKGDRQMKSLLAPLSRVDRARALLVLKSTPEFEQLVAAVKKVRTIADLRTVVRGHALWPILIFDAELFAHISLMISNELVHAKPSFRKQKIQALRALVARWWMPAHLVSFFENMGGAYLAHDGYPTYFSPWQSDYLPLTNISPFSSIKSVRYSGASISREAIRRAWYGHVAQHSDSGRSLVVCVDDEIVAEQGLCDIAVPAREELSEVVVESALPEYHEECALVSLSPAVAPVRKLQLPGENISPSRYFCTNFDIDALARTLSAATTESALKIWDSVPGIELQRAEMVSNSDGRELMIVPQSTERVPAARRTSSVVNKKREARPALLKPTESILTPNVWGNTLDSENLARLLARAVRTVFQLPSRGSAAPAGGMYALEAPVGMNLPAQPLWRRCQGSFWPSLYRKRYHFAFAGAAIGAIGAAYCLSKGIFGAYSAASPYPMDHLWPEIQNNPSFKLTI